MLFIIIIIIIIITFQSSELLYPAWLFSGRIQCMPSFFAVAQLLILIQPQSDYPSMHKLQNRFSQSDNLSFHNMILYSGIHYNPEGNSS